MSTNKRLTLILILYVTLAAIYSVIVPIGRGADEWAHYWYAQFIAQNGRLPLTPAERETAGYKSDWPPLYHLLAAGLTDWVDTEGPPTFKIREDDIRRRMVLAQGPEAILHTEDELFPWQQEILVWHLGRFLSIGFSVGTLVVTYGVAVELFGDLGIAGSRVASSRVAGSRKQVAGSGSGEAETQGFVIRHASRPFAVRRSDLALVAVAVLAFNPRFLFTGMLFNYDSLTLLLSALFVWLSIRVAKGCHSMWGFWGLGALAGLALVTKYLTLLLPLVIVYVAWVRVARLRSSRGAGEQEAGSSLARPRNTHYAIRNTSHLPRTTRPIYHYLTQALIAYLLVITPWFAYLLINFHEIDTYGPVLGTLAPLIRGDGSDRTVEEIFAYLSGAQASEPSYIEKQSYSPWEIIVELPLTFWGNPVVEPYPLDWFVGVMTVMTALALIGLILHLRFTFYDLRAKRPPFTIHHSPFIILILTCLLPLPFMLIRLFGARDALEAVQGRHILFLAGPAFAILFVYGLCALTVTISRYVPGITPHVLRFTFYALLALLLTAGVSQLLFMHRVYPPLLPVRTTAALPDGVEPPSQPVSLPNGAALLGYRLLDGNDQSLQVEMFWQGGDRWADEDYQTELALVDVEGQTRMAWLGYQTQARYPTRLWERGDFVRDEGWLPLVALPAGEYVVRLRILSAAGPVVEWQTLGEWRAASDKRQGPGSELVVWQNGQPASQPPTFTERETAQFTIHHSPFTIHKLIGPDGESYLPSSSGDDWANFIIEPHWPEGDYRLVGQNLAALQVAPSPRNFEIPAGMAASLEANFDNKIKLLGYTLPSRRAEPGGGLPVTLYWQGLEWMSEEFVIFTRLLDNQGFAWGGYDRLAQENYSTLLWAPQEIIVDGFAVPIEPDAPDGVYTLSIGWYRRVDGQAESLPTVDPASGKPTGETAVSIGPIKVGGPPAGVTVEQAAPQIEVQAVLGDKIRLLGFDQNHEQLCSPANLGGCSVSLTFYWESLAAMEVDYTVFVHIQNEAGETVAQKDRPPLGGAYPTSLWDEGEIVEDEMTISVDGLEPGRYKVELGMYDLISGDRLTVEGGAENALNIHKFEIAAEKGVRGE